MYSDLIFILLFIHSFLFLSDLKIRIFLNFRSSCNGVILSWNFIMWCNAVSFFLDCVLLSVGSHML
jgi:hypothetical protein